MNIYNSTFRTKKSNNSVYQVLLFLYILLKPFYLFSSGLPQIADCILFLLFIIILFSKDLSIYSKHGKFLFLGIGFVCYVFLVNAIWVIFTNEYKTLLYSTFYLLNIIACFVILYLYKKLGPKLFHLIYFSIIISVLTQFLLSIGANTGVYRESLFFNNPNQLGYYGLLSLATILVLVNKIYVKSLWLFLSIIACFVLIAMSLSKAAIISALLMIPLFLIFSRKKIKLNLLPFLVIIPLIFISFPSASTSFSNLPMILKVEQRLSDVGEDGDDSLTGRGYDRIVKNPEYLVIGSGEGEAERFESVLSREMHSTLGNLWFSYGSIGLFLFLSMVAISVYKNKISVFYPLIFIFLYGVTHNGIRQTMFWMLITLIFLYKFHREEVNKDP